MRPMVEFGDNFARGFFEHEGKDRMDEGGACRRKQKHREFHGEKEMLAKALVD